MHLRHYLLGRLSARLGDHTAALRFADEVERIAAPPGAGTLTRDLAQSIRAHVLADQGRTKEALEALESNVREVPFTRRASWSWAFMHPQDRLPRAELLASLGRTDEAERWYRSVEYHPESVLAGPVHLARAELYERLGKVGNALDEYRRLIELWRDADSEFQPVVERAQVRLESHDSTASPGD